VVTPEALVEATLLTEVTTPVVTPPSGRSISTLSPALISVSRLGSRLMVTCGTGDVAVISAVPGAADEPGDIPVSHALIFAAVGRNTTCPRPTVADGTVIPSAVWYFSHAAVVAALKYPRPRPGASRSARATYPSAIRSRFSCRTSAPVSPSDMSR
jgi:hypothetical protein